MHTFLELNSSLYYHRIDIRTVATQVTSFDSWPGAVIRNNLLFSADQVIIEKDGISLREFIDTLPLKKEHPLYKQLKNGFPRGYQIAMQSHAGAELRA